jgi:predicted Fe-Mo cluster-binding NifX family protein
MKIAVTTSGSELSSQVEPRFGRCPNFLIVNTETMEFEVVPNSAVGSAHGAGIGAAQTVASKGVGAVLTGNVGPNAYSALAASGIKVIAGVSGTVGDAVKRFNSGDYQSTSEPSVGGHFGTGRRGGGGGRRRQF